MRLVLILMSMFLGVTFGLPQYTLTVPSSPLISGQAVKSTGNVLPAPATSRTPTSSSISSPTILLPNVLNQVRQNARAHLAAKPSHASNPHFSQTVLPSRPLVQSHAPVQGPNQNTVLVQSSAPFSAPTSPASHSIASSIPVQVPGPIRAPVTTNNPVNQPSLPSGTAGSSPFVFSPLTAFTSVQMPTSDTDPRITPGPANVPSAHVLPIPTFTPVISPVHQQFPLISPAPIPTPQALVSISIPHAQSPSLVRNPGHVIAPITSLAPVQLSAQAVTSFLKPTTIPHVSQALNIVPSIHKAQSPAPSQDFGQALSPTSHVNSVGNAPLSTPFIIVVQGSDPASQGTNTFVPNQSAVPTSGINHHATPSSVLSKTIPKAVPSGNVPSVPVSIPQVALSPASIASATTQNDKPLISSFTPGSINHVNIESQSVTDIDHTTQSVSVQSIAPVSGIASSLPAIQSLTNEKVATTPGFPSTESVPATSQVQQPTPFILLVQDPVFSQQRKPVTATSQNVASAVTPVPQNVRALNSLETFGEEAAPNQNAASSNDSPNQAIPAPSSIVSSPSFSSVREALRIPLGIPAFFQGPIPNIAPQFPFIRSPVQPVVVEDNTASVSNDNESQLIRDEIDEEGNVQGVNEEEEGNVEGGNVEGGNEEEGTEDGGIKEEDEGINETKGGIDEGKEDGNEEGDQEEGNEDGTNEEGSDEENKEVGDNEEDNEGEDNEERSKEGNEDDDEGNDDEGNDDDDGNDNDDGNEDDEENEEDEGNEEDNENDREDES